MAQSEAEKLITWIEVELGGKVERCERQMRWRPSWFVDLRRDGELLPLYVRGDRNEEFPPWPLEYERRLLELLGGTPLPVPRVYGFCPDPRGIVLERRPGRAGLLTADSETERAKVLDELAQHIATMHGLDPALFLAAGLEPPRTPEEKALSPFLLEGEKLYRRYKSAPDPRMEFVMRWIRRNIPDRQEEMRFIHGDPGQFIFKDGRITAMLDFELASLGDPMMDIGGLRLRALHEPMGDIGPLFKRYSKLSGRTLDRHIISFYTVVFAAGTCITIGPALAYAKSGVDYPEYMSWYVIALLFTLKAIAEVMGVTLQKPAPLQPAEPPRWMPVLDVIAKTYGESDAGESDQDGSYAYDRALAQRLVRFTERRERYGAAADSDYIREVSERLGRPVAGWSESDRLLEEFVATAGPNEDAWLLNLMHDWCWRHITLVEGVIHNEMWTLELQPIDELLGDGICQSDRDSELEFRA
jgi:aminoglycoside phosphotransferase (APT) family kinase protein